MDGNALAPPPIMKVPTPEQTAQQQQLRRADRRRAAADRRRAGQSRIRRASRGQADRADGAARISSGSTTTCPPAPSPKGGTPWQFVSQADDRCSAAKRPRLARPQGLSQHFFTGRQPRAARGRRGQAVRLCLSRPAEPSQGDHAAVQRRRLGASRHLGRRRHSLGRRRSRRAGCRWGRLPEAGQWVRLEVEAAKVGLNAGRRAQRLGLHAARRHRATGTRPASSPARRRPGSRSNRSSPGKLRTSRSRKSTLPQPVQDAIKVDEADTRTTTRRRLIRDYFLENIYAKTQPIFDPLHQQIAEARKAASAISTRRFPRRWSWPRCRSRATRSC